MTEGRLLNAIPLNTLSGICPSLVSKFARLGLESLQDLLLHLPARYEDRTKLYPIGEALPGMTVTVQGEVLNIAISVLAQTHAHLPPARRQRRPDAALFSF